MAWHDENGRVRSGMGKHGSTGAQRPLRPGFANKPASAVVPSFSLVRSCFEPRQAVRDARAHEMRRFVHWRSRHINSPQPRSERSTKCILPGVLDSRVLFGLTQESSYVWWNA
jgi:hypothetical protein